jgi:hypothetical protein
MKIGNLAEIRLGPVALLRQAVLRAAFEGKL